MLSLAKCYKTTIIGYNSVQIYTWRNASTENIHILKSHKSKKKQPSFESCFVSLYWRFTDHPLLFFSRYSCVP